MISSWCLLSSFNALKTFPSCKGLSNSKPNVIKILNIENKYLYGNLLETQKQRRRKIKISEIRPEKKLLNDDIINPIADRKRLSSVKQHTKKSKAIQNVKAAATSTEQNISIGESNSEVVVTQNLVEESTLEKSLKSKKNSRNNHTQVPTKHEKTIHSKAPLKPEQFIFKSRIPINETNYTISNPEKLEVYTENCVVDKVLNYTFSDTEIRQYINFPSVSKIIEDTMSEKNKLILKNWRLSMIRKLGEEGFQKYSEDLKARGQDFHAAVLGLVLGKELDSCSEITHNALKSLSWMLKHVSNPIAVESIIAHPKLGYKGIPDCIALFRNIPVLIDWKLSEKPKKDLKDTYEAPVQVTAYIGALNHDPNYKWGVEHGLVAVAYTNGDPCDVFLLAPKHCQIYWRHWLLRLDKFKARSHFHLDHKIDEKSLRST